MQRTHMVYGEREREERAVQRMHTREYCTLYYSKIQGSHCTTYNAPYTAYIVCTKRVVERREREVQRGCGPAFLYYSEIQGSGGGHCIWSIVPEVRKMYE